MPTVRTYGGPKVATQGLPSRQQNPNAPAAAFGVQGPNVVGQVTNALNPLLAQEIQRADRAALLEAENQLDEVETALKTRAVQEFRGKDALGATTYVEAERMKQLGTIEQGLNDRQKEAFRERAMLRWSRLNEQLESHAAQEFDRYEATETTKALENFRNNAIATPERAAEYLAEGNAVLKDFAASRGWGEEQVTQATAEFTSSLHAGVVDRLLTANRVDDANAYRTAHAAEFVGDTRIRVEEAVTKATTEQTAFRAVDQVWAQLGPTSPHGAVKLSDMEAWLREQYADQPEVIKSARQELRTRVQAWDTQRKEETATAKNEILAAVANGAGLSAVKAMPAWRALEGADQNQLTDYMVNRGRTLSDRARADRERRQNEVLWSLQYDPSVVQQLSENQIRALLPQVGVEGVATLLTQKQRLTTNAGALRAATIDSDDFKTIAADAGLPAYEMPSKLTDDQRAALGALRSNVETEIARQQGILGRELRRDEKQAVMQGVIDRKVMLDFSGRSDPERIAGTLSPEDRERAYTPVERIPATMVAKSIQYLRTEGLLDPRLPDAKAKELMRRRIERAYAAELLGATDVSPYLRGEK